MKRAPGRKFILVALIISSGVFFSVHLAGPLEAQSAGCSSGPCTYYNNGKGTDTSCSGTKTCMCGSEQQDACKASVE